MTALGAAAAMALPSVYPTGVTRYDPAKAYNTYVLFSGQDHKTHLIDMTGAEVKQWAQEAQPPVLLDPALTGGQRGHVLLQLESAPNAPGAATLGYQAIGELDWSGRVVWQWSGVKAQPAYGGEGVTTDASGRDGTARQHHDWRRLPNGDTVLLVNVVHAVPGFKAGTLLDDGIYEVTPKGEVVWQWLASEHLNEFGFSEEALKLIRNGLPRNGASAPFDYLHFNNLSVVGPNKWFDAGDKRFHPDNLIVCSREANFTAVIDRQSGQVVWHLGPDYPAAAAAAAATAATNGDGVLPRPVDQIIGQHDGHIIPKGLPGAGNLLVFDNQGEAGYPRAAVGTQPRSRVLEIDPVKKEIVWQYTAVNSGQPGWAFYSSFISSARRLPNGNTLIDEGMNGRFFQVTPQGEIVWEYVSPYVGESRTGGGGRAVSSNAVYRAQPVPYDWVPEGTPRSEKPVTMTSSAPIDAGHEVGIAFANQGGIVNWRPQGDDALLVEGRGGLWYLVKLQGASTNLPYAEGVRFVPGPSGALARLDAVEVRGQRFGVVSVTRVPAPVKQAPGG
ncbi:MAG: DUF6491 family protein [Aquabacterium sp.]